MTGCQRVKFSTLVTLCSEGNDSMYNGPEQEAENKNGECVLVNKNLVKPLSTSFYSPSPVKED